MFEIIDRVKPGLQKLIAGLRETYPYASVLAVADDCRAWGISRSGVSIAAPRMGGGTGFVVRVFDGVGCAEYSFNEFAEEKIPDLRDLLLGKFIKGILGAAHAVKHPDHEARAAAHTGRGNADAAAADAPGAAVVGHRQFGGVGIRLPQLGDQFLQAGLYPVDDFKHNRFSFQLICSYQSIYII